MVGGELLADGRGTVDVVLFSDMVRQILYRMHPF